VVVQTLSKFQLHSGRSGSNRVLCVGIECTFVRLYKLYLKCFDKNQESVARKKTRKGSIYAQTFVFLGTAPKIRTECFICLCFVDRASLYNLLNKANLVHSFSQYVYCFSLHVSGDYVPIIRRTNCIYATLGTCHCVRMTIWYACWNEKNPPCILDSHPHRSTKFRIDTVSSSDDGHTEKVMWSRYRPGVVQSVGRGIALLFHDRGTRRRWVFSSTPRPHFTPWKDSVPILQEAGWAPGPVWTGGKSRRRAHSPPKHVEISNLYFYLWGHLNCVVHATPI